MYFVVSHNNKSSFSFRFSSRFRHPPSHHLTPSPFAFQLRIRDRFTQLTFLSLLEPLDFRPFGFSPNFPLLMSTFSLLMALSLILPTTLSLYRTLYYLPRVHYSLRLRFLYFHLRMLLRGTTASVTNLVSSIYGAISLVQYAATRLLSDGCFQAYCLAVLDLSLPSSLRLYSRPYRFVWAVSLLTNSTSLLLLDSVS